MEKNSKMKKTRTTIKQCFWYTQGKCARDLENTVATNLCIKKCEFFTLYENYFTGMKESDYER